MKVYTGGTFDLFHVGHVNLLARCHAMGRVIVGLNSDEFVERFKGKRPIVPYAEREAVLLACRYVWDVIPNEGDEDSKPAILRARPGIIAIGDDWAPPNDYYAQMRFTQQWLDEQGIRLIYLPRTPNVSSTQIREHL